MSYKSKYSGKQIDDLLSKVNNVPVERGDGHVSLQQTSASCDAIGNFSIALGYGSRAMAEWSYAIGFSSHAMAPYSTAIGYKVITSSSYESAFGSCNLSETDDNPLFFDGSKNKIIFSIGNGGPVDSPGDGDGDVMLMSLSSGVPEEYRHNAVQVMQSGDFYIAETHAEGEFYQKPMMNLQDTLHDLLMRVKALESR